MAPPTGDDAGTDTQVFVDAGPCTGPSVDCTDENTLRTCTAAGAAETFETCVWGCLGPTAHCGVLQPAGSGILPADVSSMGLTGEIALTGTIDGDTGAISGIRGPGVGVIADIEYQQRGHVAMFRFARLRITGQVALGGSRPIVLVADQGIEVDALVDARGPCTGTSAGPGGGSGGNRGSNGNGGGAGNAATGDGGGGGGAGGGTGGAGSGTTGGAGGTVTGTPTIGVLLGGGGGGGGGLGGNSGSGGGGGGAVQLVSNASISITSNGGINAGGCGGIGGVDGSGNSGGGGGGGGGVILLEAPTIMFAGTLAVNGGGGGGGRVSGGVSTAGTGGDGLLERTAAGGGNGDVSGGDGAAGATLSGSNGGSNSGAGGGGGGGIGWIRFNTKSGMSTLTIDGNSVLSPALDDTGSTCTQGQATIL